MVDGVHFLAGHLAQRNAVVEPKHELVLAPTLDQLTVEGIVLGMPWKPSLATPRNANQVTVYNRCFLLFSF